ncbi:MAG: phosphogluconate dehydrogenase (NADP(+)-dependent, decarboxylating) [Isosphaera sp.]|nr:phosphogluconate dehydrogenase (NADP(+)-dependent, decarboxylating) [Isosphaera sp.]
MPIPTPRPASADIGVIGMEVMGKNIALNIADHGFATAIYNRTTAKTDAVLAENPPAVFAGTTGSLVPAAELKDFVASLKRPRRIVLLVKAGGPTDATIDGLRPLLEPGDLIVDGGNAEWQDTVRREAALASAGLLFVGSGVSGGELGARFGPSLMPGGKPEAWAILRPVWEAIAAKVDAATGKPLPGAAPARPVKGGVPCTTYIGPGGAGHYVKMVHNGVEYGDMQLIAEAYHFMRDVLGMSPAAMSEAFNTWNSGELDSFLIEITADILRQADPVTGRPFVDVVLDAAGQKGTGKWTINSALDLGVPAATMAEAVFARNISAIKDERVAASAVLRAPSPHPAAAALAPDWLACVRDALYCSKVCSYAQGFALMQTASKAHSWGLRLGEVAAIFRGGCIIRARFLQKITEAFARRADLPNLLLDSYFASETRNRHANWRAVVARAALAGVPVPAFASALAYFDSYRSATLPANLIQAQRDYFGAHTYERTDQPRGQFFHIDWPEPSRPQLKA